MPKLHIPSPYKLKALKLITPEVANTFGIPAEAPVFVSPYIVNPTVCRLCHITYTPLVYQVGQPTTAQHFCKGGSSTPTGGIYVRLYEDNSGKWIYNDHLWDALVVPQGPIRMFNDKGYTYKSVTPKRIMPPMCAVCHSDVTPQWQLMEANQTLVPFCGAPMCAEAVDNRVSDWSFHYDGTEVRFTRAIPAGVPTYWHHAHG